MSDIINHLIQIFSFITTRSAFCLSLENGTLGTPHINYLCLLAFVVGCGILDIVSDSRWRFFEPEVSAWNVNHRHEHSDTRRRPM